MTPEQRQQLFLRELDVLQKRYGVTLTIQNVPTITIALNPNWLPPATNGTVTTATKVATTTNDFQTRIEAQNDN
jgi:hypothetical protein